MSLYYVMSSQVPDSLARERVQKMRALKLPAEEGLLAWHQGVDYRRAEGEGALRRLLLGSQPQLPAAVRGAISGATASKLEQFRDKVDSLPI